MLTKDKLLQKNNHNNKTKLLVHNQINKINSRKMKMTKLLVLSCLMIFASNALISQSLEFDTEITMEVGPDAPDSVLNKMNMANELLNIEDVMTLLLSENDFSILHQIDPDITTEKVSSLITEMATIYMNEGGNNLIVNLMEYYTSNFTEMELKEMLTFYETPLGKEIQKAELFSMAEIIRSREEFIVIKDEVINEAFPNGKRKKKKKKKNK